MNPIYTDMGFPADLARMAPPDPNVGVPWLLLAQAIGKLPDNLRTDGPMTFYNSLVRYEGIEHRVEDYDSTLQCVFLTAPGVCRWIPLCDQGLEWIGAIKHDEKPQLRPLETHNIIPMPHDPEIYSSPMIPLRIRNGENMRMDQLAGNWSFHNDSDAAMWLQYFVSATNQIHPFDLNLKYLNLHQPHNNAFRYEKTKLRIVYPCIRLWSATPILR